MTVTTNTLDPEKLKNFRESTQYLRQEADRIHAHRVEDDLARQKEITAGLQGLAEDNRAAFELQRAHAVELTGRINRARHTGHMALNDWEHISVDALARAIREMLTELEG